MMSKAERIFQMAQEVAAAYDLLNARRAGSGNSYTREVIDHLKFMVIEEFGPGVINQFLSKANRQSVDFWIEDEQTIMEVEDSLWSSDPLLEKEVFKALLAKEAGKDVRHLILIGDPGSVRNVELLKPEVPRPSSLVPRIKENLQPVFLKMRVVVVVQVVDAQDLIPALKQLEAGVEADEAGAAGNQHLRHEKRSRSRLRLRLRLRLRPRVASSTCLPQRGDNLVEVRVNGLERLS